MLSVWKRSVAWLAGLYGMLFALGVQAQSDFDPLVAAIDFDTMSEPVIGAFTAVVTLTILLACGLIIWKIAKRGASA